MHARSTPASLAFRAALIRALADGLSYREIERRFGASAPTISLWKQRFVKERLAGLQGRHKGGQPRASTSDVQARVIAAHKANLRWSGRKLAMHLKLDKSNVQRILSGLRTRRGGMDQLMAAFDLQFGERAVDIIGLYLDPPQYAAVFVVSEEIANRASIPEWRSFQDHRHALRELYSAFAGCVAAKQHPSVRFTDFLASLVQKTGWAPEIHILHNNLEQETDGFGRFLSIRPKVWAYSLSKYTTWVNLVGFWLSKVERDMVEDEVLTPISNLRRKLLTFIRSYSKRGRHFHWISSPWALAFPENHAQPESITLDGRKTTKEDAEGLTLVKLSQREQEIVRLSMAGFSAKEVASQLNLAIPTIRACFRSVHAGLGLSTCTKLYVWFEQQPQAMESKWVRRAIHDADPNCQCEHCRNRRSAGPPMTGRGLISTPSNVAMTSDGDLAVCALRGNKLGVGDLKPDGDLRTLEGHAAVTCMAVTADGKHAVSGSLDGTLMVWDLGTCRALLTLEGHSDSVYGVAVTPDGKRAVSASADRTIKLWDLDTGHALRTLRGFPAAVTCVAVTADGKRVVSAFFGGTLKVWDLDTGRVRRTREDPAAVVSCMAVTADGKRAVSAFCDGTLKVWDLDTGHVRRTLKGHSDYVRGLAVTADGKRAISESLDGTLKEWDLDTGLALRTLTSPFLFLPWVVTPQPLRGPTTSRRR